ncbi:vitamin B12 transporter [Pelosinus fermentans]|uniref:TonB-dependent receptor n=1 Tax=Pelosinus fermentans B4 TaxID=1149862 RepID=I8RHA4_9FIRM|nr:MULTISPECIES: TonB-dependent receptor [Pelosinus]EIW19098.1 TonB-dependent receptor [Pelosinus fermentans B4]OAM95460.1 TonB-dependent receptor [Pelosinus fermentans DSM 17108]SDR28343.1 vitamin B12 transporter [Pelosinus fermentans]
MDKHIGIKKKAMIYACIVSGFISLPVSGAYATESEETESYSFDQLVVTANRVPTKLSEVAANVTVITKGQIEKGNYHNVGEVLQHIPGVQIGSNGTPGSISAAFINGSEQVVVMIDGRRMNLPNGIGGFGMATSNLTGLIGIENIERIEIVKSGRSALYGADAVGGVINIITKKGEKNQTTVKIAGGNWNGDNYTLINEGKEGNLSWFFTADKRQMGDYSDGNNKLYRYTGSDQEAYTLRLDQKINNGNLSFTYENFDHQNEAKVKNKYENTNQHNWDFTYTENLSTKTDYQIKFYQNANHRVGLGDNTWERYDHDVRTKGFNYQLNSKIDEQNMLTAGIDWRKDEIESSDYKSKDSTVKAIYLQDRWNITNKFSILPGLRYDNSDTYGNKTTPQLGANYKQSDRTTYYASWGKVFQTPRFDDLYWPSSVDPADSYYPGSPETHYDGNPALKPETGWSAEIGVNHKFDNTLEGNFSAFTRRLNDAIAWKNVSTNPAIEYWTPSNVDKQKADGFELQLTKQLTSKIKTSIGYNYLHVRNKTQYDSDFVRDKNIADETWNIGMSYSSKKINADIRGTAVMGRTNSEFIEKSYWLWDANLNYKLDKSNTAFLTVNNILDKYYDTAAGKPCGGRNYMIGLKTIF